MNAKRLLRRVSNRATNRIRKNTTRATGAATRRLNNGTTSTTTKRRNVRTRARKAANTKVQTAPASRKLGTKATLNGKTVYWGGKNYGWQTKGSYQKIVSGKTASQNANRKPTNTTSVSSSSGKVPTTGNKKNAQVANRYRQGVQTVRSRQGTTNDTSRSSRTTTTNTSASDAKKKPVKSRTTKPTKAEQVRQVKSNLRDRGAKSVVRRTPKSARKTAEQAGGPINKGADKPNTYDITASQRDGRDPNYGTRKQPKSTNAPSKPKGRIERNSREAGREAADKFRPKASKAVAERVAREAEAKNLTPREKSNLKTKLERQAKAATKRVQKAAEQGTGASQRSAKNNPSPSAAYQEPGRTGRTWRDRLSQPAAERQSRDMTKQLSGKTVRGNKEAVQSPKGRGTKQPAGGPQDRNKTTGSYRANTTTDGIKASRTATKAQTRPANTSRITNYEEAVRTPSNKTGRPVSGQGKAVKPVESDVVGTRTNTRTGKKTDIKRTASAKERRETRLNAQYDSRTTREQVTRERGQRALNAERRNSERIMQGNQEQFNRFNGR
jgi:hypothetical protein